MSEETLQDNPQEDGKTTHKEPVSAHYKNWFLDYASYVILDRAVPYIEDGLKPVQRRILHSMKQMEDGRYNKVANIIGSTMQYHPHGDAAIQGAIVNLGQKDLLIDTQGNWGNIYTGDSAAAPRYIEARLSKFALDTVFNPKTTVWQMSYDGRKKEPVTLPVKFPLVLAQGVEGIAVGLSTKILPHNFIELIKASISYLKGRSFQLYPDFPTGGMIDVSNYNRGERGGKVRVRAKISEMDKKTLKVEDLPYGVTTSSLIDSILKANDKGKIKIKRVEDNTAKDVEILIYLPSGVSPDIMIDALYAFTDCEVSISPNCCIIVNNHPQFTNVRDVLKTSTDNTVELLRTELEIKKGELEEQWHFSSLEKIFIENRIYRDIEECETWEAVIEAIDKGLDPFKDLFYREITEEDIVRLTEIKIKRISKFDSFKADEAIKRLEEELEEVKHHLANLTDFAIAYFENLLSKYGEGKERKTEIRAFEDIQKTKVAVANQKLYVNREEGFVGTGLKKAEYLEDCSDIDNVIVFLKNGKMMVSKVSDKHFFGKGILYASVWKKGEDRKIYHMVYRDGKNGKNFVKRFNVTSITRDREYDLTKGTAGSQVLFFSAWPNGEAEVVTISLKGQSRARKLVFEYDFGELAVKGRSSRGNTLTQHSVRKIEHKSKGPSTLGGIDIWYDEVLARLNTDGNGNLLGNFNGEDRILVLYEDGSYELTTFDLSNRYDGKGKIAEIGKVTPDTVVSAIHLDGKSGTYYIKRFQIETSTLSSKFSFLTQEEKSKLLFSTMKPSPVVKVKFSSRKLEDKEVDLEEFIDVKGWKAVGNKLGEDKISSVEMVSFKQPEKPAEEIQEDQPSEQGDVSFEVVDTRGEEDQPTLF